MEGTVKYILFQRVRKAFNHSKRPKYVCLIFEVKILKDFVWNESFEFMFYKYIIFSINNRNNIERSEDGESYLDIFLFFSSVLQRKGN